MRLFFLFLFFVNVVQGQVQHHKDYDKTEDNSANEVASVSNDPKTTYLYIDNSPEFKAYKKTYTIDKIEYTANRTIFHCRVVITKSKEIYFYAKGEGNNYVVKDKESAANQFELIAIKNIYENGILIKEDLKEKLTVAITRRKNVFTYEVHFERLPQNIKTVDLIEGLGSEYDHNHFNYFNVLIKEPPTGVSEKDVLEDKKLTKQEAKAAKQKAKKLAKEQQRKAAEYRDWN